jgi:hypothetical protein
MNSPEGSEPADRFHRSSRIGGTVDIPVVRWSSDGAHFGVTVKFQVLFEPIAWRHGIIVDEGDHFSGRMIEPEVLCRYDSWLRIVQFH